MTDEARIYRNIAKQFAEHHDRESQPGRIRPGRATPIPSRASSACSSAAWTGIYQHCHREHLHRYLANSTSATTTAPRLRLMTFSGQIRLLRVSSGSVLPIKQLGLMDAAPKGGLMDLKGRKYSDIEIEGDGVSLKDAVLTRCLLIYRGGNFPNLAGTIIRQCQWQFSGAAANSTAVSLYSGCSMQTKLTTLSLRRLRRFPISSNHLPIKYVLQKV